MGHGLLDFKYILWNMLSVAFICKIVFFIWLDKYRSDGQS